MKNRTYLAAAPVRSHTLFCDERDGHDGQCASSVFTLPVAGVGLSVWLAGDQGGAPELVIDGLQALAGRRLSLADVDAVMETLLATAYDMDRAIDAAAGVTVGA